MEVKCLIFFAGFVVLARMWWKVCTQAGRIDSMSRRLLRGGTPTGDGDKLRLIGEEGWVDFEAWQEDLGIGTFIVFYTVRTSYDDEIRGTFHHPEDRGGGRAMRLWRLAHQKWCSAQSH